MSKVPAETLDRLVAGELPADEQRRLAQAALNDPELFDLLTAASAVSAARDRERRKAPPVALPPLAATLRARRMVMAAAALAAMLVLAVAYRWRTAGSGEPPAGAASPSIAAAPAALVPVTTPPTLLTARLGVDTGSAFRTDAAASREPRTQGRVTTVDGEAIEIDLGSLDGLAQGAVLPAFRGGAGAVSIGNVTITRVFRERARGTGVAGLRAGDRIDVPPALHVAALLDQVSARRSAGDLAGARALAETAVARAQPPDVSAGLRADVLNELGALQIERRDYDAAERTLTEAEPLSQSVAKLRVTNNLGALAALRGDRSAADALYLRARSLAAGDAATLAAERAAIDRNLAGLASPPR